LWWFRQQGQLNQYKYAGKSVLDLASGQGGDFGKYIDAGFSRIDGYDINERSINEASSRVVKIKKKYLDTVKINITNRDLSKNVVDPLDIKFDLVATNFAVHYFYNHLNTYIKSVKNNIKKGGHLLLTLFDGELVKDIKTDNYELKKISNKELSVFIKDSILDVPEKEPIVDIKDLIKKLEDSGLKLVENVNFKDMYPKWQTSGKNSMSKDEKTLSFMNVVLVFKSV